MECGSGWIVRRHAAEDADDGVDVNGVSSCIGVRHLYGEGSARTENPQKVRTNAGAWSYGP